MFKSFDQFINESLGEGDNLDHSDSPFGKFPEFIMKRSSGNKKKGDINYAGEMVDWIYRNQGLSARQIKAGVLGFPENTKEDFMSYKGGVGVDTTLSAVLKTPYVIRSEERPGRYYARLDTSLTIDQIKQKHRGQISGRSYGL
jgi:hypothetical protein